jgi:1-acyl-sn-glycerol-3-phosphate acyltransferase
MLARDGLLARLRWRSVWMSVMLPFLGIRIQMYGVDNIMKSAAIFVGNHRSYLDPICALDITKTVAVAKAEVSKWPVIGVASTLAGVIFVNRSDKSSRNATLKTMEKLLHAGFSVLVYPEGTTSRAPAFLPFRIGAFNLAASISVPVVPVAMEFADPENAWTGDASFLPHFLRTFGKPATRIVMSFGAPISHHDGAQLMDNVHNWIASELQRLSRWVSNN